MPVSRCCRYTLSIHSACRSWLAFIIAQSALAGSAVILLTGMVHTVSTHTGLHSLSQQFQRAPDWPTTALLP
jgi:hypothetical protein